VCAAESLAVGLAARAGPGPGDVLGGAEPSGWSGSRDELEVLRSAQLFRGLDPGDVAALLPAFEPRTLGRGARLFAQGDVDDAHVFVVYSGRFTVARGHRDRRAVTAVPGPGDMAGELSVFDPGPRTSTVTAATGARVVVVARGDLLAWGTSRPHVPARLVQVLARRLRSTNSTVVDLMLVDVAGRMAKAAARARGPVRTATRPRGVGIARADPSRARPARRRLPRVGQQGPGRVRRPRLAPAGKPRRRPARPTPPHPAGPRRRQLSSPTR